MVSLQSSQLYSHMNIKSYITREDKTDTDLEDSAKASEA